MNPRVSASALSEFIITPSDRQDEVLHDARFMRGPAVSPYGDAMRAIRAFRGDPYRDPARPEKAVARMACFTYIEGFYNPLRLHSGLGYRSPTDYERSFHHAQLSPMTSLPEQVH